MRISFAVRNSRAQRDHQEDRSMNPSEEFLKHAADCERMAKFTRDPASKVTWSRMAERWLRCAEVFKNQSAAARPAQRHRRAAPADIEQYREAG
jgi:hypothetical protein